MVKANKIRTKLLTMELRVKPLGDLIKLRDERLVQMEKVRMEIGLGREKNVKAYRNLRREYAVVRTLIREKDSNSHESRRDESKREKVEAPVVEQSSLRGEKVNNENI